MALTFELDGFGDGPSNMVADLELLRSAEEGRAGGRVYKWDGPWVSLGRFQSPGTALTPGYGPSVIRPTGGKAVLHGHDQTLGLAIPFKGRSVRSAYRFVLAPVLLALSDCGLDAQLAGLEREAKSEGADCFASTSIYDIVLKGTRRKVAGAAMRIGNGALLLQVSIPYTEPLVEPESAIVGATYESIVPWDWVGFGSAMSHRASSADVFDALEEILPIAGTR